MKAGDLVRSVISGQLGVVARVFMHKLWETDTMGKKVNWNEVEPQPFAEVAWASRGGEVAQARTNKRGIEYINVSWSRPVKYFESYTKNSSFPSESFKLMAEADETS